MYNIIPNYVPGDPYEFIAPHPLNLVQVVTCYHCFRGACVGVAVWVDDRNTHNQYHNKQLSRGA